MQKSYQTKRKAQRGYHAFSSFAQRAVLQLPEVRHWLEARRRFLICELVEKLQDAGISQRRVCRALGVPQSAVCGWREKLLRGGFNALLSQRSRCGRKPKSGNAPAAKRRILPPRITFQLEV